MKLPFFYAECCAVALAAEPAQLLPLNPLPPFHESWSDAETSIISNFASRVDQFVPNLTTEDGDSSAKIYQHFRTALHQAIVTGTVEPSFKGDTLARWAAMVDDDLAVQVFIGHGEDPHARYYIDDFDLDSGLVQEVIWARNLTDYASVANRVQVLNWLKSKGWQPVKDWDLVVHALSVAMLAEYRNDMSPLLQWFFEQGIDINEDQKALFYKGVLVAEDGLPYLKKLVEQGDIKLNEPLEEILPLQAVCYWTGFGKTINLDNLAFLLESGADPNLILAEEAPTDEHYDPEGYEEDDLPRDDMHVFSTPIEIVFDLYLSDLSANDRKREANFLAAIDLLLLHGAELDIGEDEYEDAQSRAYNEIRKRLVMSPEQLRADFDKLNAKAYIPHIENLMRENVRASLILRDIHHAVGISPVSNEEKALDALFSKRVEAYISCICDLSVLESLVRYWWYRPEPDDIPMSVWSDAQETVKWFLCKKIAQFSTQEAYETLSRLRNEFADGAWGGFFRSLEWEYLRQYSQDPAVQKSKTGVFH